MTENLFVKLLEHNNWANKQIIEACSTLTDEQLDAEPLSATRGSIRQTLIHLISSQRGYLSLLTLPVDSRNHPPLTYVELQGSARQSGERLLALVREKADLKTKRQTTDGYTVEPWVVIVQAINHATEHREQIKNMLSAIGITPPNIDGWSYGEVTEALIPE